MLYLIKNLYYTIRDLLKRIPRVLATSFGILFLIAFLVIFISMRKSVKEYIEVRVLNTLNINEMIITPVAPVEFSGGGMFQETKNFIHDWKVRSISKMAGVESVKRIIRLNHPAKIRAGMFGKEFKTYVPVSGVERNFLIGKDPHWKSFVAGKYIPILAPTMALDMYNNLAAAKGLPEMGEKSLKGFVFEMNIYDADNKEKVFDYKAKVFGFTPLLSTSGVIVPAEFIRSFCGKLKAETGSKRPCYSTTMLVVKVKETKQLPGVADRIKKLKLNVKSQKDIAEKTQKIITFIDAFFIFIMPIILLLTVVAIFNSYLSIVYHRTYEISLQRVLGASKFRIILSFLLEAGLVGFLYGLIGYIAGYFLVDYISRHIGQWFPMLKGLDMSIQIDRNFYLALLLSTGISALSALLPAIFASNMSLFNSTKNNR